MRGCEPWSNRPLPAVSSKAGIAALPGSLMLELRRLVQHVQE
jgi:hypothetical protein